MYPLASSPSPQPVVNCYHEYVANGEGVSGHEEEVDFNNKSASGPPFASPTNSKRFVCTETLFDFFCVYFLLD